MVVFSKCQFYEQGMYFILKKLYWWMMWVIYWVYCDSIVELWVVVDPHKIVYSKGDSKSMYFKLAFGWLSKIILRILYLNGYFQQSRSSVFLESEGESEISKALPAEDEVVFADESDVTGAPPALPAVFAELAGVGPPKVVWHVARIILIFYTKTIINF